MRAMVVGCALGIGVLAGAAAAQTPVGAPPPVTVQDCTRLKGKAKKECVAANAPAPAAATKPADADDKFAFPEGDSKNGGETERAGGQVRKDVGDMPTSGVPDPPAESVAPPPPAAGSSSSSSSSGGGAPAADDDDAAPTTVGGDTPVKASDLKNLGARTDSAEGRRKLEQTRVEDDLKVGRYYFKDGNYPGATARYQDALQRDPDNPEAHFGLAEVLLKQNKRPEAVAQLQRYLELAPDDDHTKDAQKMLAKLR